MAAIAIGVWSSAAALAGTTVISGIVRLDTGLVYLERPAGAAAGRLMERMAGATPRLLFDPAAAPGALGPHVISAVVPSPDGQRIAIGLVSATEPGATQTRVVDATTGTVLADALPPGCAGPTAWSLDGTTLFYNRLPAAASGAHPGCGERSIVAAHRLGSSAADQPVFGYGLDPNVPIRPADVPQIVIPGGSNQALGVIARPPSTALTIYAAPIAAVLSGGQIPWRLVVGREAGVTAFDVRGDIAYLLARRDAARGEVDRIDLADRASSLETVVPPGAGGIDRIGVAADALYIAGLHDGVAELRRMAWGADGTPGPPAAIALPAAGRFTEFATDAQVDGVIVAIGSPGTSPRVFVLDARGAARALDLASASPRSRGWRPDSAR